MKNQIRMERQLTGENAGKPIKLTLEFADGSKEEFSVKSVMGSMVLTEVPGFEKLNEEGIPFGALVVGALTGDAFFNHYKHLTEVLAMVLSEHGLERGEVIDFISRATSRGVGEALMNSAERDPQEVIRLAMEALDMLKKFGKGGPL